MPRPETAHQLDWPKLLETAMTAPGHLGDTYNRFYTYSFLNQMYLLMQGICEPVATYKRWQLLGRQVVKGAKAAEIVRPINVKREDDNGDEVRFTRFKAVRCLFGYSQTTGEELPPVEPTGWDLDTALDRLDIRLQRHFPLHDGNIQGVSWQRNIAINPVAKYPLKTTFHEMGHVVLGHTAADADYAEHRGIKEFQAESTAYLMANELDVLSDDAATVSRGYVQAWLRGVEPPTDTAIRQVFTATDQILKAGRPLTQAPDELSAIA